MSMNKAVILVGGMGTRLRPITTQLPKPLVPVAGTPIIRHILGRAAELGITHAALATMFMPEKIRNEVGESYRGISIRYVNEETPIGTAGGAKKAYSAISSAEDKDVIVLSGDGMWDFDIKSALSFHRVNNADVTIVTTRTNYPTEYGIVNTSPDGRIVRFAEKPTWSQVVSDKVNTGIYIMKSHVFNVIPDGKNFDFSKDLFPKLLADGNPLYAYLAEGFWCDIGDPGSYYRCNMEALAGRISCLDFSGALGGEDINRMGAAYRSPVWVSQYSRLENGVSVGPFSVVGRDCLLKEDSKISSSILHENIIVGKNANIDGSVVCKNATVGNNTRIRSGCIVGADCTIGDDVTLCEGTVLEPGTRVANGMIVKKDGNFSRNLPFEQTEEGYVCKDASLMMTVGQMLSYATGKICTDKTNVRIGVLREDKREVAVAAESLLCGMRLCGVKGFYFGTGFEAQARFAAEFFLCDAFVYVSHNNDLICFKVFDRMARPVGKDFERAMREFSHSDTPKNTQKIHDTVHFESISFLYYNELMRMAQRDFTPDYLNTTPILSGLKFRIAGTCQVDSAKYLLNKAITELGGSVIEDCDNNKTFAGTQNTTVDCHDIIFTLADNGLDLEVEQCGKKYDMPHIVAMLISTAGSTSHSGGVIPIPFLSPKAFRKVAKSGVTIAGYLADGNHCDGITRESMRNAMWVNDAVFAALRLACTVAQKSHDGAFSTLEALFGELPCFSMYVSTLEESTLGGDVRAMVMSGLSEMSGFSQGIEREREGVELVFENGNVTVVPGKMGGFRLIGEAVSTETASELCGTVTQKIMDMVKKDIKYPE